MGHRQIFNTGQMFDPNDEQSWKHMHPEQPYGQFARAVPAENSSVYPDNMSIDAIPYGNPHWNSNPRLNPFPTPNPCVEMPCHQPDNLGPSQIPFMPHHHEASSSSYGAQTFNHFDESLVDPTLNMRGAYKRKSPGVPNERGSSSRCYDATTSSGLSIPSEMWQAKQNTDCHNTPWDNVPVGNQGSFRNVRSKALFEGDNAITRTNLTTAPYQQIYMGPTTGDGSCPVKYRGQSSNSQMQDSGFYGGSPMPDANPFNQETNNFITGVNNTGPHLEIGQYYNNLIPQNPPGVLGHSTRGSRSAYTQRTPPNFNRPSSSNVYWGHSNEGMGMGMGSYHTSNLRPLSTMRWHSNERSGRTRISSDRFRSISDDPRSRVTPEGLVIVDHSGMYGPRSASDLHRDMRLDVDNMSYEELLALGERIGSVNTGLSEDLASKCLTESVYCFSDHVQDEERCVICLDEYTNMDDIGKLRKCGHDFHVGCIKKWLFMKNLCPICKASAAVDQ